MLLDLTLSHPNHWLGPWAGKDSSADESGEDGCEIEATIEAILGVMLPVISWPMGYIIIAKGNRRLIILSEAAWTVVHLGLAWTCVRAFGLDGAGMAFFGSYVFHCFLIFAICSSAQRLSVGQGKQKDWTHFYLRGRRGVQRLLRVSTLDRDGLGTVAVVASSIYSLRVLLSLGSLDRIPAPILKLLMWCRLAASNFK